jgi:hypothetical protein
MIALSATGPENRRPTSTQSKTQSFKLFRRLQNIKPLRKNDAVTDTNTHLAHAQ